MRLSATDPPRRRLDADVATTSGNCDLLGSMPGKERLRRENSTYVDLPDLHSLDLFKGQLIPRSIINPGGRRTRVSGDPLRDLDGAARIHVFSYAQIGRAHG